MTFLDSIMLVFLLLSSAECSNTLLIDPETPKSSHTTLRRHDGKTVELVFSDEFNTAGRSFEPGADPIWEAITAPDYTNDALEFYNASKEYVTTRNGALVLTIKAEKTYWEEWNATANSFVKNQVELRNINSYAYFMNDLNLDWPFSNLSIDWILSILFFR